MSEPSAPKLEHSEALLARRPATPWLKILILIGLTWVPLLVLSLAGGRAAGPTPELSFLKDFATHARFLIAIPLLVVTGVIVERRIGISARIFIDSGLVIPEDVDSASRGIRRLEQLFHSKIVAGTFVGVAVLKSVVVSQYDIGTRGLAPSWGAGDTVTLWAARTWFNFVAIPIFQFFLYLWAWRLAVWCWLLWRFSRMRLTLVPTHPDRAGGLGFLMYAQWGWADIVFALGCVLSGFFAFQILYEGVDLTTFRFPIVAYLIVAEAFILSPLLPFALPLARAKREGLLRYGEFAELYVERFEKKWLVAREQLPDSPLGNSDIQSLADLGTSFESIGQMRAWPFDRKLVVSVAVLAALPFAPLVLLVYPVADIVELFANVLL